MGSSRLGTPSHMFKFESKSKSNTAKSESKSTSFGALRPNPSPAKSDSSPDLRRTRTRVTTSLLDITINLNEENVGLHYDPKYVELANLILNICDFDILWIIMKAYILLIQIYRTEWKRPLGFHLSSFVHPKHIRNYCIHRPRLAVNASDRVFENFARDTSRRPHLNFELSTYYTARFLLHRLY
jgi:hypothetical protein